MYSMVGRVTVTNKTPSKPAPAIYAVFSPLYPDSSKAALCATNDGCDASSGTIGGTTVWGGSAIWDGVPFSVSTSSPNSFGDATAMLGVGASDSQSLWFSLNTTVEGTGFATNESNDQLASDFEKVAGWGIMVQSVWDYANDPSQAPVNFAESTQNCVTFSDGSGPYCFDGVSDSLAGK